MRHKIVGLLFPLLLASCARVQPSWRPAAGEPTVAVHVYRTAIHSVIGLPGEDPARPAEEWAFGQKLWFYDTQTTGSSPLWDDLRLAWCYGAGFASTLVWPSRGVVETVVAREPLPLREPEAARGPGWVFHVRPERAAALRAWLQASRVAGAEPLYRDSESVYYPSRRRYWLFYTCHHYTARALSEAGLPIGTLRGMAPWWLWRRLDALQAAEAPAVEAQAAETSAATAPVVVKSPEASIAAIAMRTTAAAIN